MSEPAHTLIHDGRDWPAPGEWSYEDYLRIPRRPEDGRRFEIIRGVLYVTATPTWLHQHAVWRLGYFFQEFVRKQGLGTVAGAPFDIVLPDRLGDPVQPDLFYFRTGNEPAAHENRFAGVPDLMAEVLSPSTRRRDRKVKLEAYRDAGVPEYWLVDPQARTVTVFGLDEERARYVELARGGEGERVTSVVLAGLAVEVSDLFP
ncbi:MAG: Uma2 family endonuclease [Acidobacteriota bacterium]